MNLYQHAVATLESNVFNRDWLKEMIVELDNLSFGGLMDKEEIKEFKKKIREYFPFWNTKLI